MCILHIEKTRALKPSWCNIGALFLGKVLLLEQSETKRRRERKKRKGEKEMKTCTHSGEQGEVELGCMMCVGHAQFVLGG